MTYILIGLILYIVLACGLKFAFNLSFSTISIGALALVLLYSFVIYSDYSSKTSDTEIWSGKITKVEHKEEWEEWIPERVETYTTTDSKGNVTTHTRVIPGYWQHHDAENYITTSDNGRYTVNQLPDGRKLTDKFINSTEELEEYYPTGSPTASTHSFTNKVQSSYSVFKHKEIDLDDYKDLHDYPKKRNEYYSIDRLLGDFKDKTKKSRYLDAINAELNDTDNPNNNDKVKGYKQVNLILVNFGDKTEDYGYALQDYWENGAKNDFVVTFGTDKNGKPTWCYAFSWSEVEILKTDVRELIMSKDNIDNNKQFEETVLEISNLIEDKYIRREFAEFDYIQVDLSTSTKFILAGLLIAVLVSLFFIENNM